MTHHSDTDAFDDLRHIAGLALSRAGKTGPVREGLQVRIDRLAACLTDREARLEQMASPQREKGITVDGVPLFQHVARQRGKERDELSDLLAAASAEIDRLKATQEPDVTLSLQAGNDQPWSLRECLSKLVEAADILLHQKDYDGLHWELIQSAWTHAKGYLAAPAPTSAELAALWRVARGGMLWPPDQATVDAFNELERRSLAVVPSADLAAHPYYCASCKLNMTRAEARTHECEVDHVRLGKHGLELQPDGGARGWSVFTGCEGETPRLVGFFTRKEDAELLTRAPDPDEEDGEVYPLDGNNSIDLAALTPHGIVTANDYEITTHEQLEARIEAALGLGEAE